MNRTEYIMKKPVIRIILSIYRYVVIETISIVKNYGIRGLIKRRGKKFIVILVCYYMVRDVFLYIVLPFLMLNGFFNWLWY